MTPERIASIVDHAFCVDFETDLVQAGLLAPPLVCGAVARVVTDADGRRRVRGELMGPVEVLHALIAALRDPRAVIINLNVAFDLLVAVANAWTLLGVDIMPLVFAAYEEGRVLDPAIVEQLHHIALGCLLEDPRTGRPLTDPMTGEKKKVGYRQSVVVDLVLGLADAKKNDRWRSSYALLRPIPMEQWPPEARQYPVDDVEYILTAALAQIGAIPNVGPHAWGSDLTCARCGAVSGHQNAPRLCVSTYPRQNLHDVARQCFAAWAMQLGAAWGFRTDPFATEFLAEVVEEERRLARPQFVALGFLRADGSKDTAAVGRAVALAYAAGGTCPEADPNGKDPHACYSGRRWKSFSKRDGQPLGKGTNCKRCCGTGLDLGTGTVPMNAPSSTNPHGSVKQGKDPLSESGDDHLMALADYKNSDKILATYLPDVRRGYVVPWTLRPNVLLDTGRSSYSGTVQLMPRQLPAAITQAIKRRRRADPSLPHVIGIRDCIAARGQAGEIVEVPDDYVLQPGEAICPSVVATNVRPLDAEEDEEEEAAA